MQTVAELPVARAEGRVAGIYRAIMTASGTGTPALIIRHFATFPGFLEWVWEAIGAEIGTGEVLARALAAAGKTPAPPLDPLSAADLAAAGVEDRALLAAVLANYNRMNPMNFALIATIDRLLAGDEGASAPSRRTQGPPASAGMTGTPPDPVAPLPAPVDMATLPPDLARMLVALSDNLPQSGPRLVPTLYRHLALWPDLMRRLGPGILARLGDGSVARATARFEAEMTPVIDVVTARSPALPPAPLADPREMRRTIATFLAAIPQMTVIGRSLDEALSPGLHAGGTQGSE